MTATYATATRGTPTYLNLDVPYPNQVFTILIWPEKRASFGGAPEVKFANRHVCIEGFVSEYNGSPQIVSNGGDIRTFD